MPTIDKIYQIFVSSTYEDLKLERQEVMAAIVSTGNVPIGMEYFPAGNAAPFDYIKHQIDKADYYVLILAGKYGTINNDTGISYTEMEFNYAVKQKVPIAVLQYEDINKLSADKVEFNEPRKKELLDKFRETSRDGRMAAFWSSPIELKMKVKDAVCNLIESSPRIGWIRANQNGLLDVNNKAFQFDYDSTLEINHHIAPNPFDLDDPIAEEKNETRIVSWRDIIKELGNVFTTPLSMFGIIDTLCSLCGGMDKDCANIILDTLVTIGVLKVDTYSNEYNGVESYCAWTSLGYKIKSQLTVGPTIEYRNRDIRTLTDLMSHFSTNPTFYQF